MKFRNDAHRVAVKQALLRLTGDQGWPVMCELAEEVIHELERKALYEDDEEKARTYRNDARGARKFWDKWRRFTELTAGEESASASDTFLEVVMD